MEQGKGLEMKDYEAQQLYRAIQNEIAVLKARLTKGGDVSVAQEVYTKAEELFDRVSTLKNNRLFAQDAKIVADLSELIQICIRNLDFDDGFSLVNLEDVVQYAKRYMLRDHLESHNIEIKTERGVTIQEEERQSDDDDDDEMAGAADDAELLRNRPGHIAEMVQLDNRKRVLRQFDEYTDFNQFNWLKMGVLFEEVSKYAPTVDHLIGPFAFEKKKKVQKERAQRDGLAEKSTAENLTKEKLTHNQEVSTPEQVQRCFKILKRKNGFAKISLFKFIIDPHSFARSTENLFYTSFLLKENKLELGQDNEGLPVIGIYRNTAKTPIMDTNETQKRRGDQQNHIIFQLDMPTWRKIIEKFDITEPFLDYER
ncbi:Non-structural maintenance of chromosome element 4 [Nakaseomyces bracarensis]|uniref:Non-structural maintenance of chromosomes element 4 n=1 Tax=Nakaseomyces bracarensis TaxID=273131 RepID=A0ABR4NPI7_9SACH